MAAVLALFCQLALGTAFAADGPEPASGHAGQSLDALLVICHAGAADAHGGGPAPHRHDGDCALCPFCRVLSLAAALPAPPPPVAAPAVAVAAIRAWWPATRAPPARAVTTAYPRGPPDLT